MSRVRKRRLWRGDSAAGPVVSAVVAIAVFGLGFATVVTFQGQAGQHLAANAASPPSSASDALTLLLSGPGAPPAWEISDASADSVSRLGIARAPGSHELSAAKVARLGGGSAAANNGRVDVDEARAALGLSGMGFHMTLSPIDDLATQGVVGLESSRIAYVGDYASDATTESVASGAESALLDSFPLLFRNARFGPTALASAGDEFPDAAPSLRPQLVLRLAGWNRTEDATSPSDPGASTWRLYDAATVAGFAPVAEGTHVVGIGTDTEPGYVANEQDRLVTPKVDLRGASGRLSFVEWIDGQCLVVLSTCATPLDYPVVEVSLDGVAWTSLTAADRPTTTGGAWRTRAISLDACVPCAAGPVQFGFRWVSDPTVSGRGWFVDDVRVYDANGGHTMWSDDNELSPAVSVYRILVVGSDAESNAFTPDSIKSRIRDWVLAGGTLVVLGHGSSSHNWMEPMFGVKNEGAAIQPAAPDAASPVLLFPNKLAWNVWSNEGGAWAVTPSQQSAFVQILGAPAAAGSARSDTLSVSAPGAWGEGKIVLSAYAPARLPAASSNALLTNVLMEGSYTGLSLDFGDPLPTSRPVSTASRAVLVPTSGALAGGYEEAILTLQLWIR